MKIRENGKTEAFKLKNLLFLLMGLFLSVNLFAQTSQVGGKVVDETGSALIGVTVVVKGTTNGTVTNIDGNYTLAKVPENATLVFSFIGMTSQEISRTGKSTIDVTMKATTHDIDELVVVGYGTQKKSLVTGSIAKVDGSDLQKTGALRVNQALQGKTAGVVITNSSGQPGDFVSIRIRGVGTNGDNEPLYIVDGLPTNGYGIDYLNSTDIESVEVLKDAASAAIYGARGGNGVVLITTKKGKKGDKFNVSYDGYYGYQNPWHTVDVLNAAEYMDAMNEAAANSNVKPDKLPFTDARRDTMRWDTDWQEEMLNRNAMKQNHVITMTGGSENSTYASSISYFKQDGIVAKGKSGFERLTYRLNTTRQFGMMTFGSNINLVQIDTKSVGANDMYDGSALSQALNLPPVVPVMFDNGKWATPTDFGLGMQEITNPIAMLSYRNSGTKTRKAVANVWADFDFGYLIAPLSGLKFKTSYNYEYANTHYRSYSPIYDLDPTHKSTVNGVSTTDNHYVSWNIDNTLTYVKSLGDHNFTLLAGHSAFRSYHESLSGSKSDVIFDDFEHAYLDNATDPLSAITGGTYDEHTILSYFGRIDYDYANKYMLTATLRRDGSSRFGTAKKYGYFPSLSAGWVISRESFFPETDAFNFLKIRASWGQNGNENIGDFQYISTMNSNLIYYFGLNQDQVNGMQPAKIANPSLKWETSEQANVAFDFGFFNNKLTATVDLYSKTTKDWLITAPVPMLVGNSAPTINGGSVNNKGLELEMGYKARAGNVNIDVKVTGAFNRNEVIDIPNTEKVIVGGSGGFGQGNIVRFEVGQPAAFFWGYKTDGLFQTADDVANHTTTDSLGRTFKLQPNAKPGDVRFVDTNKDGLLTDLDRVNLGNAMPEFTGGLNLSLDWKGIDFNMFWYVALGQETWMVLRRYDQWSTNYTKEMYDGRWTGEGTSNKYPRLAKNDLNFNGNWKTPSDLLVYDSSFGRLRSLTVGYTFPKSLTQKAKIENLRFYVMGENLITLTNYPGFDPEIGSNNTFGAGVDRGVYPQPKTITFGMNITF
ncbi:MAG: TonB-dependent receptor [Bacteroidales bacterium]|nr:TonB-dependent receptor [Bacteroidales bacterium]